MAERKVVALLELGGSHVECLHSQLLFLKRAGYVIHLLLSDNLQEQAKSIGAYDRLAFFPPGNSYSTHWQCVFAVRKYLTVNDITCIVLNTAEGNHVRDLCLIAPLRMVFTGILHHTDKLRNSFTQWIISFRVKKYFVLNDYLLDAIPRSSRYRVQTLYAIFFAGFSDKEVQKDNTELWIVVPGEVEYRRRDYEGLLDALVGTKPDKRLKFIILGKCDGAREDGKHFRDRVENLDVQDQFVFFDEFIDAPTYYAHLRRCDAILPLIHPNTSIYENYEKHQVSGAYNLSFGFHIPMLVHAALSFVKDFQFAALVYGEGEMISMLNELAEDRSRLALKRAAIQQQKKFTLEYQAERYITFLEARR